MYELPTRGQLFAGLTSRTACYAVQRNRTATGVRVKE